MTFGMAFEDWIRIYESGGDRLDRFRALVAESGYSDQHFRDLFKAVFGQPPMAYLTAIRLETARGLLPRLDRGHLTAIDVDEWWVARARRNLRRYDNVDILLGDVRDLPLEDGGFDLAVVHLVIHDIAKEGRRPIIEALAGKLRDGGRLFIKEPTKEPHGMPEAEIWALLNGASLRETVRVASRSMFMGPLIEGQFKKVERVTV